MKSRGEGAHCASGPGTDGRSRCTRSVAAGGSARKALSRLGEPKLCRVFGSSSGPGLGSCKGREQRGAVWSVPSVPVRTRAGTVKARLGTHPPTHTPLEWKSHRLPAWCVCVCVCLGCGWGEYPHTSRGGRNVAALRVASFRSVAHASSKMRIP